MGAAHSLSSSFTRWDSTRAAQWAGATTQSSFGVACARWRKQPSPTPVSDQSGQKGAGGGKIWVVNLEERFDIEKVGQPVPTSSLAPT